MTAEEKNKKEQEIIADLASKNERKIIGALKRIPHEGTPAMIRPMFDLLLDGVTGEQQLLLDKVLHNLKDKECRTPLIDLLKEDAYYEVQPAILASIWQSGLDVQDEVEFLTDVAINGEFMTVLEVVTILENLELTDTEAISASIKKLDKAVEIKSETQEILVSMRELLLSQLLDD